MSAPTAPMWDEFDGFVQECGAPALPDLEFIHESPWLNLYVYPAEADYVRAAARWASAGTGSSRACAPPTATSRCPTSCAPATARWSTCRSARWARPTSG